MGALLVCDRFRFVGSRRFPQGPQRSIMKVMAPIENDRHPGPVRDDSSATTHWSLVLVR